MTTGDGSVIAAGGTTGSAGGMVASAGGTTGSTGGTVASDPDGCLHADGLPRVAAELYRTARRLRVFVLRPVDVPLKAIVDLIMLPGAEVAARLAAERSLVSAVRG